MTDLRQHIVAEARSWIGTPFRHRAMVKGAGVDCACLALAVYSAAGAIAHEEPPVYARDWMLHKDSDLARNIFARLAVAVARADLLPADLMLLKVRGAYGHFAIITQANPLAVIHATPAYRFVVEERVAGAAFFDRGLRDAPLFGRVKALA